MRFDVPYAERKNALTPTYDKKFSGSITKQIRDFRTFISDSAFFEIYQKRSPSGGFIEEPEYPTIAIDEAVVNSVAHRDYYIGKPIFCLKYTDAFVVISPGGIIQSVNVPEHFSLNNTHLEHHSRNPQLMEWLRSECVDICGYVAEGILKNCFVRKSTKSKSRVIRSNEMEPF